MTEVDGDNCSYKMCKAPVKMSLPTNQRWVVKQFLPVGWSNLHMTNSRRLQSALAVHWHNTEWWQIEDKISCPNCPSSSSNTYKRWDILPIVLNMLTCKLRVSVAAMSEYNTGWQPSDKFWMITDKIQNHSQKLSHNFKITRIWQRLEDFQC